MLKFISYQEINGNVWEEFVREASTAWFVHSKEWVNLCIKLSDENENHSFGVFENNTLVAIAPLLSINRGGKKVFSFGMCNTPYPAFSNKIFKENKRKIEKLIFGNIFEIASKKKIEYIDSFVSPLVDNVLSKEISVNPLPKFAFHDTTISSNVLLLHKSEDDLYRNIRKGHKSDIKTALKHDCSVEIVDSNTYDPDKFKLYIDLHFQAAGRKTRPDETWEIMESWVKRGFSILGFVRKNNGYISGAVVNTFKQKAYYQSGATLPQAQGEKGIGHLLQWEIIKYLNNHDYTHYEIGRNWYNNISQEVADKKMLNISRFKAGFGADIFPLFRGEYFVDKVYMENEYKERLSNYLSNFDSLIPTG